MSKLAALVYWAFIALLVVFGALLAASYVGVGGLDVKVVLSGSMEPAIKTGAVVFILPQDSYAVGDVVTFGADTKTEIPTTHRIIEEQQGSNGTEFVTKGDANDDADPQTLPARSVIGKVVLNVPYLGYILDFARKPLGFTLLIGVPAVLIVIEEVGTIWKEVRRPRKQKPESSDDGSEPPTPAP